jgi:geranylgeranyl diphosphate synthase type I
VVNKPLVTSAEAVLDPQAPLAQAFRDVMSAEISAFLTEQSAVLDSMGPELVPVHLMASQMLCGGKRMRPAFCVWGYVAAAGSRQMRNSSRCWRRPEALTCFM